MGLVGTRNLDGGLRDVSASRDQPRHGPPDYSRGRGGVVEAEAGVGACASRRDPAGQARHRPAALPKPRRDKPLQRARLATGRSSSFARLDLQVGRTQHFSAPGPGVCAPDRRGSTGATSIMAGRAVRDHPAGRRRHRNVPATAARRPTRPATDDSGRGCTRPQAARRPERPDRPDVVRSSGASLTTAFTCNQARFRRPCGDVVPVVPGTT
jgi:hypothetical protein